MYKVLVVDDEKIMLKGLVSAVDWNEIGCEICGVADSGRLGAELIVEKKPDILITDIKMYSFNGLDMIEKMAQELELSKVIVMTGYRDFDYAKRALDLGVFGFVLKPFSIEEIVAIVEKAVMALDRERNSIKKFETLREMMDKSLDVYKSIKQLSEDMTDAILSDRREEAFEEKHQIEMLCALLIKKENYSREVYKYVLYTILSIFNENDPEADKTNQILNVDTVVTESASYEMLMSLIDDILNNVLKRLDDERKFDKRNVPDEIVRYVNEHYMEPITLDVIAQNMFVNYHHASKMFKKLTGKSFLNYLNSIRIEKAKEFCITTGKKDYEIAKMVGIEDAYYFSRLFKRYVGMSASEYRKRIKHNEEEN